MNYTDKQLEQIDAYFTRPGRNGDVPHPTSDISSDPALKEAYDDVEMLWHATRLERLQGKLEMLKQYEAELRANAAADQNEKHSSKVVALQKRKWILSIAAGFAILVVAGLLLFRNPDPQTIHLAYLEEHFSDYVLYDVMRSDQGQTKVSREQEIAYNLFAIKDFKKAMPMLKKEWEENRDTLALFYLITCHMGIGESKSGQKLFEEHGNLLTDEQRRLIQALF